MMRKFLLFSAAIIVSMPALAQSAAPLIWNPGLSFSGGTLTGPLNLSISSNPTLTLLGGTSQDYALPADYTGRRWEITDGSTASPITANGPSIKISRTESYPVGACAANPVDNTCNSAVDVWAVGDANDNMQVSAVEGNAITATTQGANYNAVGVTGHGRVIGSSTAKAIGAYFQGRRDPTTGRVTALQLQVQNNASADCGVSYTGFGNCNLIEGTTASLSGFGGGTAIHISPLVTAPWGGLLNEGVVFNEGTVSDVTFADHSSSTTSYKAVGSHTDIVDASGATCSGSLIKGPSSNSSIDCTGIVTGLLFKSAGSYSIVGFGTSAGAKLNLGAQTITSEDSGTVANTYINKIGGDTLASGSATTLTNVYAVDIEPPVAGTNVTITNPVYALRLGGRLDLGTNNAINGSSIVANSASGYQLVGSNASATVPTLVPHRGSTTTGFGAQASGNISGIIAGTETTRIVSGGLLNVGFTQVGSLTALTLSAGEIGMTKIAASGTAPGAAGLKIAAVCGTNAGSAKLISYAGTSTTPVTIADNIGSGVTGC